MVVVKTIKKFFNSNGLTLVELLASIVIIGIIFTSFFSYFSQTMLFSSKVEDKFSGGNIAERILYETEKHYEDAEEIPLTTLTGKGIGLSEDYYLVNNKKYYPIVTISCPLPEEQKWGLYRVLVQIYDKNPNGSENASLLSELFGYIEKGTINKDG